MRHNYFIHTFETDYGPYLFDVATNSIVALEDDVYNFLLDRIDFNALSVESQKYVNDLKDIGMLSEIYPTMTAYHLTSENLKYYIGNRLQQVILCLTEGCNLSCTYCTYEWKYNEKYRAKSMDCSIAYKAIDLLIKSSKHEPMIYLSFYGGEPLLNIELIKSCVTYAKSKVRGQKLLLSMTTNGVCLTDEVQQYLVENDFVITLSLDGPSDIHDRYRKFKDGRESQHIVVDNLRRLRYKWPEYFSKNISVNAVLAPPINVERLRYFMEGIPLPTRFSYMNGGEQIIANLSEEEKSQDKDILSFFWDRFRSNPNMDDEYKKRGKYFFGNLLKVYKLPKLNGIRETCFPGGLCIPGVRKIFVSPGGNLFPCERVDERNEKFLIGNVNSGVDEVLVKNLINWYTEELNNRCTQCWAVNLCEQCFATAPHFTCERTKKMKHKLLIDYVNITNEHPNIKTVLNEMIKS